MNHSAGLTVRLTEDEMARLRAAANERGPPVSAVVRAAIAHAPAPLHDAGARALITALHDHDLTIVRTVSPQSPPHQGSKSLRENPR
jgi:uncharacterized protein (DUF1778 family)